MSALKTRPPTGRVPWPLILIEGGEKAGKSWAIAELSASPKVGQTYWIDLGEGSADEYGSVAGARYLVVEHNGTFAAILQAVEAIRDLAAQVPAGEPPVVLGIDSMTAEWDLLKGQADATARARLARKGKAVAADAEPQISMDLWNAANTKHRRLMTMLMTFPGIVVMTARGKEVAALDAAGRPVEGSKEYRVEGQKNLAFDASVWLRVSRDHPPLVVGARSVHAGVRPGVDKPRPAPGLTLERVVFDILRCNPAEAEVRQLVELSTEPEETPPADDDRPRANALRDWAFRPERTGEELREALAKLKAEHQQRANLLVVNEHGDDEVLSVLLQRRIHDAATPATDPAAGDAPVTDEQHRHMHALWREVGYAGDANRDHRLAITNRILGRDGDDVLTSSKELTSDEADRVITALRERRTAMRRQSEGGSE
jgi:hypothetical protein